MPGTLSTVLRPRHRILRMASPTDRYHFPLPRFKTEQEGSHGLRLCHPMVCVTPGPPADGQALRKAAGAGQGLQTSKNPPAMPTFQLPAMGNARDFERAWVLLLLLLFICVWDEHARTTTCMWRSKDSFQESVLTSTLQDSLLAPPVARCTHAPWLASF